MDRAVNRVTDRAMRRAAGAGKSRVVTETLAWRAGPPAPPVDAPLTGGGRLLLVFAHPDDEAFFTAGTVAGHVATGGEAALVSATRGEMGSQPVPPLYPREELGRYRSAELRAACRIMGVSRLTFLGYLDGALAQADPAEAASRIARVLARYRPDAIVTFGPEGIYGHPDHVAIHHLTVAAYERVYGEDPGGGGARSGSARSGGGPAAAPCPRLWYVATPSAFWRYRPNDWVAAARQGAAGVRAGPGAGAAPGAEGQRRPLVPGEPEAAISIGPWLEKKIDALLAHRSQRHNVERAFGGLYDFSARAPKDDEARAILSREYFTLARGPHPGHLLETSLLEA